MSVQATKADVDRVAAAIRRRVLLHTIENNGGYLCRHAVPPRRSRRCTCG